MTTTVTFVTSPVYTYSPGSSSFVGTGNNLVGVTATAYWSDSTSETATFVDSGGTRGDAIGTGWRLYVDGNDGPGVGTVDPKMPYSADVWNFVFEGTSNELVKLVIDGESSTNYVLFDADNSTSPPVGTPNTGGGITWEIYSGLSGTDVAVTYDKCAMQSSDSVPYEDIYLRITLEFSGTAVTSDFSFFQDHDYAASGFTPPTTSKRRVHVCVHV